MRNEQTSLFDDNPEYEAFVEKFKPKKTTDDCYTPPNIYEAVADWVAAEYGVDKSNFVRPFWPGGDYESMDYQPECIVVDNPPFSILAQIQRFYVARGVRFFLFAPTLTMFAANCGAVCYLPCGVQVTYQNGAKVNTSFITNMDSYQVRTAPDLYQAVKAANATNEKEGKRELPKYSYPDNILTSAMAYHYSQRGVDYRLSKEDCTFVRALDAQRSAGKSVFGGGFLLSDRAAAERAAAERAAAEGAAAEGAAAHVWTLSERERAIIDKLGKK